MALLTRPRRGLALALLAMLLVPAVAIPLRPFKAMSPVENRLLARPPPRPQRLADWARLPRRIDAYLADHFAFRDGMIAANNRLFGRAARAAVSGQADLAAAIAGHSEAADAGATGELAAAVEGKAGRMFLTEGLLESTGRETDRRRAADYAQFVCQAVRALRARGIRPIFAIAPSPAAIYPEYAPDWALPPLSPTEYDLILRGAAACGAPGIDLRPALRAAKAGTILYRFTDSHWREVGALAGFNALVAAAGHPEWVLDPKGAAWTPVTRTDGDLPRLAGLPARAEPDYDTRYVVPPADALRGPIKVLPTKQDTPFALATPRKGASLLIIGDSYTEHYFPGFFLNAGLARVGWVHEEDCGFDWGAIGAFSPDYVLIMPVERLALCRPRGARPKGVPR